MQLLVLSCVLSELLSHQAAVGALQNERAPFRERLRALQQLLQYTMVETRETKRVVAERQHPLYHRGTVELVCAYVGPGHWAFKAPISKLWLQCYRKVPVNNKTRLVQYQISIQMTNFKRAFASPATLQYALDYGLKWGRNHYYTHRIYSAIGKCADEEVLRAAFEMGMPKHASLNDGAAEAGDLAKLKFLCKEMKCPLNKYDIMMSAVKGGSVPLLKFLAKEGCKINDNPFAAAASSGSVPVLDYLFARKGLKCPPDTFWLPGAARLGHLNVLQWAADRLGDKIVWNRRDICTSAAQSGSIEMMQFLQQRGADLAEHNGSSNFPLVKERITTTAARGERKEMLLWLKQQGILPTVHAMCDAAERDMLDMCLFLYTEGCPWDDSVLNSANTGYYELVQALYEQGCPIEIHSVRSQAASYGRVDILQYLLQLPDQPQSSTAQLTAQLNGAAVNEQLAAAKWLRQQGAEWPEVLVKDGIKWRGELLQWARRAGCTSALPVEPV
jgi:hypothetical protein